MSSSTTTKIAWLTDVHFNFLEAGQLLDFLNRVRDSKADAVFLGGDIAEATDVSGYLKQMDQHLSVPIYFVLGNHDYYYGSIETVRREMKKLCSECEKLTYLNDSDVIQLAPDVALIGHDGWADGRIGDYENSTVMLNDYKLIKELAGLSKTDLLQKLGSLGDEAAQHIRQVLPEAASANRQVILLTHVPPTRESCWNEGEISDDEWAPHFACQAVGEAILEIMRENPQSQLTVLCGHTHSAGQSKPLENVLILTGAAEYGHPEIQKIFEFDRSSNSA